MRFAYRKTAYRIIHNLSLTKILKEAKHRSKGIIEPQTDLPFCKIKDILEIHVKRQGYSLFWAGYSWALPWEYTTMWFQMQETKRTRECPTAARGQGLSGKQESNPSSHLPSCWHNLSHYLNTTDQKHFSSHLTDHLYYVDMVHSAALVFSVSGVWQSFHRIFASTLTLGSLKGSWVWSIRCTSQQQRIHIFEPSKQMRILNSSLAFTQLIQDSFLHELEVVFEHMVTVNIGAGILQHRKYPL